MAQTDLLIIITATQLVDHRVIALILRDSLLSRQVLKDRRDVLLESYEDVGAPGLLWIVLIRGFYLELKGNPGL